jgi:CDP-diacylglycerol--glycerol-3-phosphate 3-phosphatidyltransferase
VDATDSPLQPTLASRRKPRLRDEFTNLPNILTFARIVMIPGVLYFTDNFSQARSFIAGLIYLAAAITDSLDGYLARKRGQVSVLGKFLDPLADKIMVMAALVYCVALDRAPAWLVVVVLARELAITGLRSIAASEGIVIAASMGGKHKTAFQLVGITFLLVHFRYRVLFFSELTVDFHFVGLVTLYISLALSVISAIEYVKLFAEAVAKQDASPPPPPLPTGAPRAE